MKKVFRSLGIILTGAIVFSCLGLFGTSSRGDMLFGNENVSNYDRRIVIWDNPAGNSDRSKFDDMDINFGPDRYDMVPQFGANISTSEYRDIERIADTYSYIVEIERGFVSTAFNDQPYLIPYIVEGSDTAVIILPGGGFALNSMDGADVEALDIAQTLNNNGISAFVLHYRTNPYRYPIPYLDAQRAVRYIRYHAADFHLDPDKIGMIGFSAGANIIGTFINIVRGQNFFPADYVMDDIDRTDDRVMSAAMIYPLMSFRSNVPMLFCLFDANEVRSDARREELLMNTDLFRNINSQIIPQFIAYGSADSIVGTSETIRYINSAVNRGCSVTTVVAEGQNHGFDQSYYMDQYIAWLKSL